MTHLGSVEDKANIHQGDQADGTNQGVPEIGLMEIDCWVSSQGNPNVQRDLRQMVDMVKKLFRDTTFIPIKDLYTSISSPTNTGHIIRIIDVRHAVVPPDPNPALSRERLIIEYRYEERF